MYKCPNCDWTGEKLAPAQDLHLRLEPGDTYPEGQCPECSSLIGPDDAKDEVVSTEGPTCPECGLVNELPDGVLIDTEYDITCADDACGTVFHCSEETTTVYSTTVKPAAT